MEWIIRKVTRISKQESTTTDDRFSIPTPSTDTSDNVVQVVIEEYPCHIRFNSPIIKGESTGQSIEGYAILVGERTNLLQEGDIIDNTYVVSTEPQSFRNWTRCFIRRLD